jgi:hypothetical protein
MSKLLGRLTRSQLIWVLGLALTSGPLLHGFQLELHSLFWDHSNIFSTFAQHYDSLTRFGQLQWWSYNGNGGIASYYLNILGNNYLTPLSVLSSFSWWVAGRAGVNIVDWLPYYVIYHMILVPFIFLVGFYSFLCHFVRNPAARFFGLTLAAFGPAAVSGVYGLGMEQTGYAFLFVASWLRYAKQPNINRFLLMTTAAGALFITLNHLFLYWVIVFLPLVFAALQFMEPKKEQRPLQVLRSMPLFLKVALASTLVIVTLPTILTFVEGSDWVRSISNSRIYDFEFLRAGNPLQLLATVVPGVGFQFFPNNKEMLLFGGYALTNPIGVASGFIQYNYLGPLCGALALVAVVVGPSARSRQLLFVIGVGVLIVVLSGYSPIFAPLLVLPTPLRSVNHYSDATFILGISSLIICLAAQGYAAFLKSNIGVSLLTQRLFWVCAIVGIAGFAAVYGGHWREESIFGFFLVVSLAIALVLMRATRGFAASRLSKILLVLVLIDVSTNAFWWVRNVAAPITFKQGRIDTVASPNVAKTPTSDYASILLAHRQFVAANARYGSGLDSLPEFSFSTTARSMDQPRENATPVALSDGVVELPDRSLDDPMFKKFDRAVSTAIVQGHIETKSRTYNSMRLLVDLDSPAIFLWKGLRDPSWIVEVDSQLVRPAAAYGVFTAIPMNAGKSEVTLRYRPRFIPEALTASILWLIALGTLAIFIPRRRSAYRKRKI